MIFVTDFNTIEQNANIGKYTFSGNWCYYYGNGEYGDTTVKGDGVVIFDAAFNFGPLPSMPLIEPLPSEPSNPTEPSKPSEPVVPVETPASHIKGVADSDGVLTVKDATCVQKYLSGSLKLDEINLSLARVCGNTQLTIKDATRIQKQVANIA